MVQIGHLFGYVIGSVDLVGTFGTSLGGTQFKQLTVIFGLTLIGAVGLTSYAVEERVLVSRRYI